VWDTLVGFGRGIEVLQPVTQANLIADARSGLEKGPTGADIGDFRGCKLIRPERTREFDDDAGDTVAA